MWFVVRGALHSSNPRLWRAKDVTWIVKVQPTMEVGAEELVIDLLRTGDHGSLEGVGVQQRAPP